MSRVIKLEGSGKERKKMTRETVLAIRELMTQGEVDDNTRDLAAFISLTLEDITNTVEESVVAWEKRGYWIKADRFRMEWEWCQSLGRAMREAIFAEDWQKVAIASSQIAGKLNKVEVPARHRLGEPWVGAMNKLKKVASTPR